ncbi:MAG: 1-deoxy-D-xylulose-5-phosphate synthase [Oscillospiraceae bacterium]|jgi:1-deoxy-D-xylulose-5-phosphate synthase|nr:1-deoxy-D-xylulose-5-phosphate synthase [Oscillospiraceae bacterium]
MLGNTILNGISSPEDLKKLNKKELNLLCEEIRHELIETIAANGGHLASNLGVVELTVALHSEFNSPHDKIVFDVGHQCYTHKLLTGRKEQFNTLRKEGGLSGFPTPEESEHDPFTAGHSSTSISVACGLAKAKTLNREGGHVIAVIGDGALSGGLAYEGLNNAGRSKDKLIVVLNDNKMSISRNVGSMSRYLALIRTKGSYRRFKGKVNSFVIHIPFIGQRLRKFIYGSKTALKSLLYRSTLFEDMGFAYVGPVDGHNLNHLSQAIEVAKEYKKPVLLHVCTVKGKGYSHAEKNPRIFHGVSGFDVLTGDSLSSNKDFSGVLGEELCRLAKEDKSICAITAAMKSGTGLSRFYLNNIDRFFDVGIAEEHAVTFASGLAAGGMKPVFAVYSSFLQRGYDQLVHDVAIQNTHVVFAVDRAGFVGEDGVTHQGMFDAAFFNTIPNIRVYSPCYFEELRLYLNKALYELEGACAVRYPRGAELPLEDNEYIANANNFTLLPCDNGEKSALLVTYGRCFSQALKARRLLKEKGVNAAILKLGCIKPIDERAIQAALEYDKIYFFEEGTASGGIGERFCLLLVEAGYKGSYKLTATEGFIPHAKVQALMHRYKLDAEGMAEVIYEG